MISTCVARHLFVAGVRFAVIALVTFAMLSPLAAAQSDGEAPPEATAEATLTPTPRPIDLNPNDNLSAADRARLNPFAAPPPTPTPVPTATADSEEQAAADDAAADAEVVEAPQSAAAGTRSDAADTVSAPQAAGDVAVDSVESGAAGDGGSGGATGDGGTIIQSATITGNNRGSEIVVNDCAYGSVQIDGGEIVNASDIELSANGGVAVSTANGGGDNVVRAGGAVASQLITAGNGGAAGANANGGTIITGATITGNNRGHEVTFADCPNGRGDATLVIDAGTITNTTDISMSANGGTAIGDASGGDGNIGITGGRAGSDAAAGNGGQAVSGADGGTIIAGPMITGNNRGNTIVVGEANPDGTGASAGVVSCLGGSVLMVIDGGDISNATTIDLSADGGIAVSDAGGGNGNLAGSAGGVVAAGNGGTARSEADGGLLMTGAMITGNNRGNAITVGNVSGCAPVAPVPAAAPAPAGTEPITRTVNQISQPDHVFAKRGESGRDRAGGKRVNVQALPNTGTGSTATQPTQRQAGDRR